MPELPEVETIKNDLKKVILDKKIILVDVKDKKAVKSVFADFLKVLSGNEFEDILRVGKLLAFKLKRNEYLLIHLKMTGQLIFCDKKKCIAGGHNFPAAENNPTKFTRAVFKFANKSELYFNDMRRFGYLKIVDDDNFKKIKKAYGVEPISKEFDLKNFKKTIQGKKKNIKAVLMDQSLIAGIGNIYADEVLFEAGIMPTRPAGRLSEKEQKEIFKAIKIILKRAIKHRGTTFSDYLDAKGEKGNFTRFLRVYGRAGKKCYKCRGIVKKIKIGGRGTSFCPKCQK